MRTSRIPWDAIRTEYITGSISHRKLAEKYHISAGTVGRRASREQWSGQRTASGRHVADKVLRQAEEKRARELSRLTVLHQKTLDLLEARLDRAMLSPADVTAAEVLQLANTIRTLTQTGFTLWHIPTVSEDTAQQRLHLERERFAAEQTQREQGQEAVEWRIVVEGDGSEEDYSG